MVPRAGARTHPPKVRRVACFAFISQVDFPLERCHPEKMESILELRKYPLNLVGQIRAYRWNMYIRCHWRVVVTARVSASAPKAVLHKEPKHISQTHMVSTHVCVHTRLPAHRPGPPLTN